MGAREADRMSGLVTHPGFLAVSAAVIAVLVAVCLRPPAALDESAPDHQFSAARAMVFLDELLAESEPHVAGSPLNREIRARIEERFRALGYEPEIQAKFHCNPHFGSCAKVENIIAVRRGTEGRHAVLLTAHYDGSWAGPGAADDGSGAASIVEIARMLNELGDIQNDVIFLITDAEEQGLVGAHAFAEHHPLFAKVRAVINIEARGVSGPSMMFETGDGNRSMIRILSRSLERPTANSLAYEVYKRMPIDTDYSMYRNRGVMGVNFAFSQGYALYHSRLDDVSHLDSGSVQHQGQNAWSMLVALANRDIGKIASREDAAYVDVLGRVLVHYPVSAASGITVWLAVLVLLGIVFAHKKQIRAAGVAWAILAQLSVIVIFAAGTWLLNWPLGAMVETNPVEHPMPWAARISVLFMVALAAWIGGKLYGHRVSLGEGLLVAWASIAALAFLLDFRLPAASFLALLPMAAFFVGTLLDILRWRTRAGLIFAGVFGFWMATYLAFYFFYLLGSIVSFDHTHLMAAPLILMLVALLPLWFCRIEEPFPDWRPGMVVLGAALLAAIYHQFLPGFTEDRPRGMNLVYRQLPAQDGASLHLESPGGGVDTDYAKVVGMEMMAIPPSHSSAEIPLNRERPTVSRYATTVSSLALTVPSVDSLATGNEPDSAAGQLKSLEFVITAPEGSERVVIAFPRDAQISKAYMNGELAIDGDLQNKSGRIPTFLALPYPGTAPISVEVTFRDALPAGFNVSARYPFPQALWEEYRVVWPDDAQPIFHGFRSEVVTAQPLSGDWR